ncbi:hypothetical protein HAX54_002112, partial [Datura stramonium]|nr:hypothetical protein [Datura stramonium]
KDFTTYADVCFKEFGDRILYWTTLNEANVFALGGYDIGVTPPGRCSSPFGARCNSGGNSTIEQYIVAHNMLLTHASIVTLYKNKYKSIQQGFLGINVYTMKFVPNTNTTADAMAAERAFQFYTGWFINPVIFGDYPEIMKKNAGTRIPIFTKDESEQVKGSVDFIGINHYFPSLVKDKSDSLFNGYRDFNGDMAAQVIYDIGHTLSTPYEVRPSDLYAVLEQLKQNYGNPTLFVHENGQRLPRNQTLIDTVRIDYVRAYIGSVLRALR